MIDVRNDPDSNETLVRSSNLIRVLLATRLPVVRYPLPIDAESVLNQGGGAGYCEQRFPQKCVSRDDIFYEAELNPVEGHMTGLELETFAIRRCRYV